MMPDYDPNYATFRCNTSVVQANILTFSPVFFYFFLASSFSKERLIFVFFFRLQQQSFLFVSKKRSCEMKRNDLTTVRSLFAVVGDIYSFSFIYFLPSSFVLRASYYLCSFPCSFYANFQFQPAALLFSSYAFPHAANYCAQMYMPKTIRAYRSRAHQQFARPLIVREYYQNDNQCQKRRLFNNDFQQTISRPLPIQQVID